MDAAADDDDLFAFDCLTVVAAAVVVFGVDDEFSLALKLADVTNELS